MEVTKFQNKLNKLDNHSYMFEEKVDLTDGVYEAELAHDNIVISTLSVYTGPKLTGQRIGAYTLSTPSLTPWKRVIRVYADVPALYISYETTGDTVEADDVNRVQDAVQATQEALNGETVRAQGEEQKLADGLQAETTRAKQSEKENSRMIAGEAVRAEEAEEKNAAAIALEAGRAQAAEQENALAIAAESIRATASEQENADNISAEAIRAAAAEKQNADAIFAESMRAGTAENKLSSNLSSEISRAKGEEKAITEAITTETARAKAAEQANAQAVTAEAARAKAAEKQNADAIGLHVNSVDAEIKALQEADAALELKKANAAEVNAALDARYTKDQTYSRQEVLRKIEELIGTAPDTLDTFREIADALGNDPNFATTIMNALAGKVDKADGKGLSSNDYSSAEKDKVQTAYNVCHSHGNKTVLDKITQILLDNWTDAYNKRHEHGNKGVLDGITAELIAAWNVAGGQKHSHENKTILDKITQAMLDKLDGIEEGANKYVHPATSGNKHIPAGGSSGQILRWKADGTAAWGADNNTTYGSMKGATASAAGASGLVPAPAAGSQSVKYLRADGTWQTPPNTQRGIQNNLTSTSAADALSAAQGKVLKGLMDDKLSKGCTWGDLKGV